MENHDTGAKNYFTISNMNLTGVNSPNDLASRFYYESGLV